ncbi:MAG: DUF4405 domain-containing protein [Gammaproteobacteria bacterium]
MKRTALNLLVDFLAALSFVGMIATGYILRFPLPPGTNKSLILWGLSRHQWGDVHFWISLSLLIVLLIHLVLHWQWVVSVVARQFGAANACQVRTFRSGMLTLLVVGAVLGSFAWVAEISVEPRPDRCCPSAESAAPLSRTPLAETGPAQVDFRRDVYPILAAFCLGCHGPGRAQGGFRADRKDDFFGSNGKKAWVVPGNSAKSPLFAVVSGAAGSASTPFHTLSEREAGILRAWIDAGADWPEP